MNEIKLCDLLEGTDITLSDRFDIEKELTVSEWGDEISDNSLLIITKRSNGKCREKYYQTSAYAVICERDDGYGIEKDKVIYTENARRTLAICYFNLYRIDLSRIRLVAVTGTNGKTTVASMLHYILRSSGEEVGYIGT